MDLLQILSRFMVSSDRFLISVNWKVASYADPFAVNFEECNVILFSEMIARK